MVSISNLKEKTWGTIISNAALSNHIIYSSNYDLIKYEMYLKKYQEILRSIKLEGEFIYAPGFAEIEKGLDDRKYEITKNTIA